MSIKNELDKLKTVDIYSLLLFVLFKLRDIPEYNTLSELAYILEKDSLLNICEYFGGQTITVPTIEELEGLVHALLLYQYVELDGFSYNIAIKKLGLESYQLRRVKKDYKKICEILENYEFI